MTQSHRPPVVTRSLLPVALLVLLAAAAQGGPLEDADAVYGRGEYAKAIALYRPLADGGDGEAQYRLGAIYDNGLGVPQDEREAAAWYTRAALQGVANAQFILGLKYEAGLGIGQDYVQAYRWMTLAAAGYADEDQRDGLVEHRDQMAAKMTPAQVTDAQRLAADGKPAQ